MNRKENYAPICPSLVCGYAPLQHYHSLEMQGLWFSAEGWDEKPSLLTASTLWEIIPPAVRVCVPHPSSQATPGLPVSQAYPGEGDFLPKAQCSWGTCSSKQWLARGWLKHLPEIQTAASCAELFPAGTAPAAGFFFSMGMCNSKPAVATASELKSKSCKSCWHQGAVILLKFMDFTESEGRGLCAMWEVWTFFLGSHTAQVTAYSQVTLGWDWWQCLETVLVLRQ